MPDKKNLSAEEKKVAEAVHMKNVRRNIKIRCAGKMHGKSCGEDGIYRRLLVL